MAFLYALLTIGRGWIPHDDGMLGQAAVRVLTGELPHRDFQDVYTGGLSYWHALSFALFGINLMSPRILLLASFGGFLLASFAIARRFAGPRVAAATVLLGSVWSLPNYPAAMPTWYNLFLAVAGIWCVVRFLEGGRRGWLAAAGVACGLSIAIKIVGLYTLAAFLIGLALVESEPISDTSPRRPSWNVFTILVSAGLLVFALLVAWLVRAGLGASSVVHFVLPSAAVAGFAAWRVARSGSAGTPRERIAHLLRLFGPFAAGVAAPIALLLAPFALSGSVDAIFRGVLVLPPRRLLFAATPPLPLRLFAPSLLPLGLAAVSALGPPRVRRVALGMLAGVLGVAFVLGGSDPVYLGTWAGLLLAPAITTLAALAVATRAWALGDEGHKPLVAALTAAVLATFTLVQYPFAGPVYFFYLAPLVALCALSAVSLAPVSWRAPALALGLFALAFGARWVGTADLYPTAQGRYEPRPALERLDIDRGHIRVTPAEKAEYERLAAALQDLAAGTGVTFVTPDAPEVYFLSGLRNPTPVFYDFLDEAEGRTARILAALDREDVRVIALNRAPQFSGPPSPDLLAALEGAYPRATSVGRFVVRWR